MRLTLEPLAAGIDDAQVEVHGPAGLAGTLWTRVLEWTCRDQLVQLQVLAADEMVLPAGEASEPVIGAIARLRQALHGSGGLIILRNPHAVFGLERIALASGVRLFAIASPVDESCWDAALSLAQPVYGIRGTIACEATRVHPAAVISALAYGNFVCEEGLRLERLDEDRTGVRVKAGRPIEATVIVRGGFEAARLSGDDLRYDDRGTEAYVRLVLNSDQGRCWTQPRFVQARPGPGSGHAGA